MRSKNSDGDQASNHEFPWPGFYRSFGKWILISFLLLSPVYFLISGRVLSPGDMSAYVLDVSHWLPQNSRLIRDMEKFSEVVGKERGSVVRISWPGCSENDPRLRSFARKLEQLKWPATIQVTNESEGRSVFNDVLQLDDVVANLKKSEAKLTDDQIYNQLSNVMVGPDGTTCIVATLSSREPHERAFAIRRIYELANEVDGLDDSQVRLFGGPVYTKQVDDSGLKLAMIFLPISAGISLVAVWFCLRTIWVVLAVFLNSIVCTSIALVSLYVTGAVMDPLLMLLPGFWFIMSISSGIHFVNYYFDSKQLAGKNKNFDLASLTASTALWPCLLATITTCIGLASLCTNEVLPLWRFGFHASIGLLCSFIASFLFLPSWLSLTGAKLQSESQKRQQRGDPFWKKYGLFSRKLGLKTAIAFLLLLVVTAVGFSKLEFSNKLSDQFSKTAQINTDAAWFEEEIGPLLPFEILVRFPKSNLPRPSQRLEYIAQLQTRIDELEIPCKTLSATCVVPYTAGSGARQLTRRVILDKKLNSNRDALTETGFVVDEPNNELWRITVFAYNSVSVSMNDYFGEIQKAVEQQTTENANPETQVKVSYAGLGSRMAVITRELGGGLMRSCFTSAILISLIVIFALRSFTLGLTAMLPNLFPIIVSFGAFGFIQPRLDIGSIMTASIAMGIAVDDTIHFMYWFQQGIRNSLSRDEAIRLAIKKCGRAIASTSIICGLGFAVYAFCDFMPAVRFGQLLFVMLSAALVGDLVFLPALLRVLPNRWIGIKQSVVQGRAEVVSNEKPNSFVVPADRTLS